MNRQQKEAVIADFKEEINSSQAVFVINYKGLDVVQLQNFRKQIRAEDALFKVTKARLMKRAVQDLKEDKINNFENWLKGQIGLVFAKKEVPLIAKAMVNFSKENKALEIIGGFFDSELVDKEGINSLAQMPSKEILFTRLVWGLAFPMTSLVTVLNEGMVKLARVLKSVAEQKEKGK